jgi:hypothetical protein
MSSNRTRFNNKRRFASPRPSEEELKRLSLLVRYGGNPRHKRHPGDFGLTPPAMPREDKSLCDAIQLFNRADALKLLRLGAELGMISPWDGTGYPKYIWSMKDGVPVEAILENPGNGTYHGYPLEQNDDFRDSVIAQWKTYQP